MPDPTQKNWEKFQKSGLTKMSTKTTKGNTTVSINFLKPAKKKSSTSTKSSAATSKPTKKFATQKKAKRVISAQGVKLKTTTPSVVNAQKKKTATTATKKSNRATRKTDKLRSKGQEALASGNLRKAKRLSDRSRRTAKRAIKARK